MRNVIHSFACCELWQVTWTVVSKRLGSSLKPNEFAALKKSLEDGPVPAPGTSASFICVFHPFDVVHVCRKCVPIEKRSLFGCYSLNRLSCALYSNVYCAAPKPVVKPSAAPVSSVSITLAEQKPSPPQPAPVVLIAAAPKAAPTPPAPTVLLAPAVIQAPVPSSAKSAPVSVAPATAPLSSKATVVMPATRADLPVVVVSAAKPVSSVVNATPASSKSYVVITQHTYLV